jgi:hypothetical protein
MLRRVPGAAGWIGLYRTGEGDNRDLTTDEAEQTIADWRSWAPVGDGPFLYSRDDRRTAELEC